MISTATSIENLTLNITQEIHVRASLEVTFAPCPKMVDGRHANNTWLQEMPDPVTKLVWDNAAILSPATAKALGLETNIHWLGSRRDVPELLQASDLGVLASHQEGFSNAVIESMAASLPMVVTNVGGNSEAVLHGLSGLVVPARNPARLGDAIAEIACDPERGKAMGEAGRIRAEQHFSLTACLDKYETMYRSLLAGQGLPRQIQSPSVMRRDETYGARARLSGAVAGYSLAAGHAREFATVTFAKTD